jgi:hypothetical protein
MTPLVHASEQARADGLARITKEIGRLDAWSFWAVPADDHVVVAGTTGVFLVVPEVRPGALEVQGRRVRVGGKDVRLRPRSPGARRCCQPLARNGSCGPSA